MAKPPPTECGRRLLFVTDPMLGHVTVHIRGKVYQELFAQNGWQVDFISRRPDRCPTKRLALWRREKEIVRRAAAYDIVYLLKVPALSLVRRLKHHTRAKIIFDLTDALWLPHHQTQGWKDLDTILAEVDAVFSENDFVCAYGRRHNSHVFSIPVYLALEKFDRLRSSVPRRQEDGIVVGWIGSATTANALEIVREPLETLSTLHEDLTLRVLGCDASQIPAFTRVRLSCRPQYDEDAMVREVLAMDIGIFPPPLDIVDYEIRGALKGMIYMAGGIPAIFQNAGDCRNFIRDGDNGMLASTPQEWCDKLRQLIESAALRRQMGQRGLDTVRAEHSLGHVYQKLEAALLQVCGLPRTLDQ